MWTMPMEKKVLVPLRIKAAQSADVNEAKVIPAQDEFNTLGLDKIYIEYLPPVFGEYLSMLIFWFAFKQLHQINA